MKTKFTFLLFFLCVFSQVNQIHSTRMVFPYWTMSSNVRISSIGEDGVVSLDFYTDGGLYQNPALLINSHRSAGINQVASRVLPNLSSECIMVVRAFIMRLTPKM